MRYILRTLLIVLALGPPALAGVWLSAQAAIAARQKMVYQPAFHTNGITWAEAVKKAREVRNGGRSFVGPDENAHRPIPRLRARPPQHR